MTQPTTTAGSATSAACERCPAWRPGQLQRLGVKTGNWDYLVALAGNPNTGKSTVFNALTGLRQHTGNWPGKTISRAEGGYRYGEKNYKLVDLPGTYSLLSASADEEVAREFLLFGHPDVTVVVCDATALERNLNLLLQVRQITGRVVVALNLMDEARAQGIEVEARGLARDLGVRVVPVAARRGEGLEDLLKAVREAAEENPSPRPFLPVVEDKRVRQALDRVREELLGFLPGLHQAHWIALRLLEGDASILAALRTGRLGELREESVAGMEGGGKPAGAGSPVPEGLEAWLEEVERQRWELGGNLHDPMVETLYAEAERLARRHVRRDGLEHNPGWRNRLDRLLTGKWTGLPVMALILLAVLWLTIIGANVPSAMLANLLVDQGQPWLKGLAAGAGVPAWVSGLLVDGVYLTMAWVVSVMMPPMAIFFPLFTLLEDFGYLPRVAYNLDGIFRRTGAHGKQALTMAMGFGCNAAGVIATRIIESPRERLVAILTNNFALCNGRWPTQILLATVFVGALVPPALASLVAAGTVFGVAMLGVLIMFGVSWALSRSLLRGEASAFSLELPPYRPPQLLRTLYTSLIDRTLFVLWRAVVFAAPAGLVIWTIGNVETGGQSLAHWLVAGLEPLATPMGLTGVILLAYVVAIPANEIVVPTILMLTVMTTGITIEGAAGAGVMFETEDTSALAALLQAGGWTTMTAVCLMLFSLCHNPCSTTLFTIYKETGAIKWAVWAAVIPLAIGCGLCAAVAGVWRWVAG